MIGGGQTGPLSGRTISVAEFQCISKSLARSYLSDTSLARWIFQAWTD